ncbi:MFS transporter [Paenibacillus radicis (ex Gao et al. 2016)]|uniref:MFS transporter n=1 Tax=Paenibacillus radicis (ex Gao et al. 2016) TaxID=1737354 RepID=A0A917M0B9_9BACL|nr:MFS transporter [Paenibacillus radicis (ex Gao et al. 2016)]GGG68252.1 MFS transporter [Paenibacillus radicis (ex Gao et al. 2016)]
MTITQLASWQKNARILWGGRFLTSMGLTGISPFIPFYLENMKAGTTADILLWTGLSLSAPAVSYALLTPFWGKLGDRWSRKWMVVRALLGLALSMFLMAVAQTPFQFFLFRLCQGAFGGISDASSAFVGTHAPHKEQGVALGRLERASALGLLAGPLLGSLCVSTWGSRPLLFITAALTGLLGVIAASILTDKDEKRTKASAIKSTGVIPAFLSLVRQPLVRRFVAAGMLFKLVDFSIFAIFTPFIRELFHSPASSATIVGLLLAVSSLGELIGAPWWGRRNDRNRLERNLVIAGVLCALCLAAQTVPLGIVWLLLIRFLQGFFYSALLQTVMLAVLRSSSSSDRGVRVGATNSLLMIGQISGPTIGLYLGAHLGMSSVFFVMCGVMIAASLLFWQLPVHAQRSNVQLSSE